MEFNIKNITTATTSTTEVVADKVKLVSPERTSNSSIKDIISVSVSTTSGALLVSHDLRDLKKTYNKDSIKKSLVTIYGKNSRIAASSKDIETLSIPLSELPARLEYNFTVMENNTPIEYTADYLIPTKNTTTLLSLNGSKQTSTSESTIPEAITILDTEIANIKTNLQDFSFIYDKSQNKVVPLQQLINNLSSTLEEVSKSLEDVKKKVENMQNL